MKAEINTITRRVIQVGDLTRTTEKDCSLVDLTTAQQGYFTSKSYNTAPGHRYIAPNGTVTVVAAPTTPGVGWKNLSHAS